MKFFDKKIRFTPEDDKILEELFDEIQMKEETLKKLGIEAFFPIDQFVKKSIMNKNLTIKALACIKVEDMNYFSFPNYATKFENEFLDIVYRIETNI